MKITLVFAISACLLLVGCNKENDTADTDTNSATSTQSSTATSSTATSADESQKPTPGAIENGVVTLNPTTTQIRFVGTHADPEKPDPRTGQFTEFNGEIQLNNDNPESIQLEIQTDSVATEIGGRLTDHLKSPDFFDVREYPTATFKSTRIEAADTAGEYTVTGDLTMHGVTKEISFPATAKIEDGRLTLNSEFTINRSEFGMTYGPDRVLNDVDIMVAVGTPTSPFAPAGGPSFGRSGPGRRGGAPNQGATPQNTDTETAVPAEGDTSATPNTDGESDAGDGESAPAPTSDTPN